MYITEKRVAAILNRTTELCDEAERFLESTETGRARNARVYIKDGQLAYEYNTACHCHPEYTTEYINLKEFTEWAIERQTPRQ